MPLPILQSSAIATPETLIRLFHKTQLHWTQHLGEESQLAVGSAITNPELSAVADANCVSGAALPADAIAEQAITEIDSHFLSRGLRCLSWTMNPSAKPEQTQPLIERLLVGGYHAQAEQIFYLDRMPANPIAQVAGLKIIPARASFRHAEEIAAREAGDAEYESAKQQIAASLLHLDDPHYEAILALKDGSAIASTGVLTVGEVGRIQPMFVSPDSRREGIGQTMMSRALEICARSLFKHIFISCSASNAPALAMCAKFGFRNIGESISYMAPRPR